MALAKRLFSAGTNSASCKRLFSAFGNLLTKLRNRLTMPNMQNLADLTMHIKDEHRNNEEVHRRLRRHFELDNIPGTCECLLSVLSISIDIAIDSLRFQTHSCCKRSNAYPRFTSSG